MDRTEVSNLKLMAVQRSDLECDIFTSGLFAPAKAESESASVWLPQHSQVLQVVGVSTGFEQLKRGSL